MGYKIFRVLHWDVSFFRVVHDWEFEVLSSFVDTIYGSSVRGIEENKMFWKPDRNKGFKVNVDYYLMIFPPCKSIWKQKIPSQVAFFVWTVALGKCLTIDNLRKRKVWNLDWCYM